eukprot:314240-Amphidinium_carterae.1
MKQMIARGAHDQAHGAPSSVSVLESARGTHDQAHGATRQAEQFGQRRTPSTPNYALDPVSTMPQCQSQIAPPPGILLGCARDRSSSGRPPRIPQRSTRAQQNSQDGNDERRTDSQRGSRALVRVKEAEKINLKEQPTAASLQSWLVLARQEIIAASGRTPQEVLPWILRAENPNTTLDQLQSTDGLDSLDSKLASALLKIARGHVQWTLQLFCQRSHKNGRGITGRQLLQLFVKEVSLDSAHSALYDVHDLMAVRWTGDTSLRNFLETWTFTVNRLNKQPAEDLLRSVLWGHLKKVQSFAT